MVFAKEDTKASRQIKLNRFDYSSGRCDTIHQSAYFLCFCRKHPSPRYSALTHLGALRFVTGVLIL